MGLSSLKDQLDARGIRLIGIAGEHLGREEFLAKFWKGELYFDLGKKTWFPAIHGGSKFSSTMSGIFSALSGGAVAKAWKRAQGKGVEGNLKGEGTVLGGVWVVHPQQGVLYEFREKSWGDNVMESDPQGLFGAINKLPGMAQAPPVLWAPPVFAPATAIPAPNMQVGAPAVGSACGPKGC